MRCPFYLSQPAIPEHESSHLLARIRANQGSVKLLDTVAISQAEVVTTDGNEVVD